MTQPPDRNRLEEIKTSMRDYGVLVLYGAEGREMEKILAALRWLIAEVERLRRLDLCSVCGNAPLPSGRKCICDGRGTAEAERIGLRRELFALDEANER